AARVILPGVGQRLLVTVGEWGLAPQRWARRLTPPLPRQEERAAFDIHSYGDQLAASCGGLGEWHSFASLVAGKPAFEVCRSMLASLQLANDYTVEISQQPG
ncbi:non-SMC condensin II complex subunit H2 L homeolog, partial [Chelydra serpentina]